MRPARPGVKPLGSASLRRALFLSIGAVGLSIGAASLHPSLGWILANLWIFGFPAFVAVVVLRELIRISVALSFRFQLFGVRWGVGPTLLRFRFHGVHHHVAAIPLGSDSRLASIHPTYHRLARWSCLFAPLLIQFSGLLWSVGNSGAGIDTVGSFSELSAGWAPLSVLQIANAALLMIQLCVPLEIAAGFFSDLRIMIVMALSSADAQRAHRAVAATMRIESLLESTALERARTELDPALRQLGRQPALVQLESRIARGSTTRESGRAATESTMTNPFEYSPILWHREFGPLSLRHRIARRVAEVAPVAIVATLFLGFQFDALLASAHQRWTSEANTIARASIGSDCLIQIEIFESRLARAARIATIPRERQIRELRARAALHACTRNFDRAALDQSLAVQIADTIRQIRNTSLPNASRGRIEAELLHSAELRQLAAWHAARGAYRDALRTTARAAETLLTADQTVSNEAPSADRTRALRLFEQERQLLEAIRQRIIEDMGVHG